MQLKQAGFNYTACGPFTKRSARIQKFRETRNLKPFYRNQLDKGCLIHDAAYSNSKDLAKRTISDTILKDRAYEIARKRGYNGYQIASASMVHIIIITPSSLKETFMIKQLIQI